MIKLNKFQLIILFIVAVNKQFIFCDNFIDLAIEQGVLSGTVENTLFKEVNFYSFKGIPYAEPPVNELRFRPPVPHKGWSGILEAHDDKPTCVQQNAKMRMGEPFGISGSEDCLYVNVFTPSTKGALPVVIFDYNDDFRTGFNGTKTYSPDFFVEEDVVVVTVSHRLGIFGYLTTEDDSILPNIGLRDYIAALQWVKNNIDKFGGDPNKVTLMGSRGGAVLVNMLLYVEKAKGLFDAVIIQGGTVLEPIFYPKNSRDVAFALGKALGIETDDSKQLLEELQQFNATNIIEKEVDAVSNDKFKENQISSVHFSPIVEKVSPDALITSLPEESTIINDVPVLIGYNSRTGLEMISHHLFQTELLKTLVKDFFFHFPARVNYRFEESILLYVVDEIKKLYYGGDGRFEYEKILDYSDYIGDIFVNYAANKTIRRMNEEVKSPVYAYIFDFRGALNENSEYITRYTKNIVKNFGATIADELCYLFVCSRIKYKYNYLSKLPSEQPEIKVIKKMVKLWTNFIKTRDPTPDANEEILKGINWEPINKNNELKYMHILKKMKMRSFEIGEREAFWDEYIAKYEKLAVNGVVVVDEDEYKDKITQVTEEIQVEKENFDDFIQTHVGEELEREKQNETNTGPKETIRVVDHVEL